MRLTTLIFDLYVRSQGFAIPSAPAEEMDPIAAVVVIAGHLARLSTAYFPKPSNLNSEDGLTGEVLAFINPTLWGTIMLSAA